MLHKKDEFISWYTPKSVPRGRAASEPTMRIHAKKNYDVVYINAVMAKKLNLYGETVKIAFSLNDEKPFLTPEPKPGVPFVIFRKKGSKETGYKTANKSLVLDILKRFGINGQEVADFDLVEWDTINGMKLYKIYHIGS